MHVRELAADEWRLWRDLRLRALEESPDAYTRTYEGESRLTDGEWIGRFAYHVGDDTASFVVEVEGEPSGIAATRIDPGDAALCGFFAMWVAPEARRRGAGRALLDHGIEWAKSHNARVIMLSVTETNTAAVALYASAGFVDTGGREPLREGSPLQIILMRKTL